MAKITSSKDILMLLLYAKGHKNEACESVRGRTRLVKMVFLFEKECRRKFNLETIIPKEVLPQFSAHDFGPFSPQVYSDLEFLVELGFVSVKPLGDLSPEDEEAAEYSYWHAQDGSSDSDLTGMRQEEFALTPDGKEFAEQELALLLTGEQLLFLNEFKARCTRASLHSLLRYVYAKYPKMTTKSKIRNEILSEGYREQD